MQDNHSGMLGESPLIGMQYLSGKAERGDWRGMAHVERTGSVGMLPIASAAPTALTNQQ